MCAIVGLITRARSADRNAFDRMRDAMQHRGPDDAGAWWDESGRVALGHRRLSIIDLSSLGHQPMRDATGNLVIVLNGEIYNYREIREELQGKGHLFRTASDTEVILEAYRAWGVDCLDHLNGMFAFALYDIREQRLLLARDRAGEKPLYLREDGVGLRFGSELKALMLEPGAPRVVDRDALECYLAYGNVPRDRCILRGYRKLPPGHAMVYDVALGVSRTWCYWTIPEQAVSGTTSAEDLVSQLDQLLMNSVRLRLLSSDVPVGILLSGGVDSSLVVAAAARAVGGTISTYTIAFPGSGVFDESAHAETVAAHFGTRHTVLPAEAGTVDLLPVLAQQFDEPSADSSMVPTFLVSRLIRSQATVALGGDGGDELFGGYAWHSQILQQARMRRWLPTPLRAVGRAVMRRTPVGFRGRNYLTGFFLDEAGAIAQFNTFFDAGARRRLLRPLGPRPGDLPVAGRRAITPAAGSLLYRALAADFRSYLVDDILVKVDRASMLTSLEVRAPWLDRHIVEFAFGCVPDHLKATTAQRKILPKMLARRVLPPALDIQRKRGFSIPLDLWMRGPWGEFIASTLADVDPRVFDRDAIRAALVGHRRGFVQSARLFALTMLELWRRTYGVNLEG